MRQAMLPNSWIGIVSCLATVMLMSASTTVESTWVQLDQPEHFVTSTGTDVVVKPRMYRVEPAGDSEIQLSPEQGAAPVVLQAESVSELSGPPDAPSDHTAMILAFEPDIYDVVLQRRGRPALVAQGSVSGIQSRAVLYAAPFTEARQPQYEGKGAIDLVGCIAHTTQMVCRTCTFAGPPCCTSEKRYYATIRNLGNGPAGPFSATFTNSDSPPTIRRYYVKGMRLGQTWTDPASYAWGNNGWSAQDLGPRPWSFSVDVANTVAEVNEGNNTSGECTTK